MSQIRDLAMRKLREKWIIAELATALEVETAELTRLLARRTDASV